MLHGRIVGKCLQGGLIVLAVALHATEKCHIGKVKAVALHSAAVGRRRGPVFRAIKFRAYRRCW